MRAALSLDGRWEARVDSEDVGLVQEWARPATQFDRALVVPLAWQAADPSLRTYAGAVWYRRSFRVPESWRGRSVVAHFGAVDYEARVWLNGREVGGHVGGYTPFEVELTSALDWTEDNLLVLRAFDPPVLDEIPHGKQGGRWYTAVSGPWQSVSLQARPEQRIARVRCVTEAAGQVVRVRLDCLVEGSTSHRVDVEAIDPETRRSVASASAAVSDDAPAALVELHIHDPKPWSPDSPMLYTVRATLRDRSGTALDVVEERVGLRTIEARDGRLYLNGEPLYVRGALDQAYWPDTLYTPPSEQAIEHEIRQAKSMGLNLLRKHIKPEDPRYLDACDRLGMLVWEEPANPSAFTPGARAALRRDLLEMIERDFNRPSVVIWSLYNEDWGLPGLWSDPACQAWLDELYREVKALDPTRPVCDNSGWAHVRTDLNDYHEYFLLPERAERFRERLEHIQHHPEENYARGHAPAGGEPVLVSEWGNWALPDPQAARDRYGRVDPAWFAYDRGYARAEGAPPSPPEDPRTERIKTVAGFEERFEQLGLRDVFGSSDRLILHVQRRAFRSLKAQIEDMRRRPFIQGWVVTELADIEWEPNGWLDYWRQPKAFTADLADLNGDVALVAIPERQSSWVGDEVAVDVWLSNYTARPLSGAVEWRLEGTSLSGAVTATIGAFETGLNAGKIRFVSPDDRPANARLLVELRDGEATLARTYAELAWAPRRAALVDGTRTNGHSLDRTLRQRLERQGYRIPRSFQPELGVAITSSYDDRTHALVRDGGRVLWLAEEGGLAPNGLELRFRGLPPGESWRMAGGSAWARADRLAPCPVLPDLGWEAANVFPSVAVDATCLREDDEQLAGWFEGWLANAGVFALSRRIGRGRVLVSTFRLADSYARDPVATLLLNRLVEILREE